MDDIIEVVSDSNVEASWQWAVAADAISGSHYAEERGQRNSTIRTKQLWLGKIGEIAVYQFLKKDGENPSKPDMIAEKQTRHNPDIVGLDSKRKYHVKTSINIVEESRSWVFEKRNTITTAPDDNDYLCLCSLIAEPNTIRIDLIEKASFFVGQYKELRNVNLTTKCCIYSRDFPCLHEYDFPVNKQESSSKLTDDAEINSIF